MALCSIVQTSLGEAPDSYVLLEVSLDESGVNSAGHNFPFYTRICCSISLGIVERG